MRKRKYGFAILAQSEARCEALRRAPVKARIQDEMHGMVECVPSPLTVHEAIHEHKAAHADAEEP